MDVLMPQLGETVAEGTVATWHKQVGDLVKADEIILDVETDKVSMEIPSPVTGRLAQILVEAGQTVPVGSVLGVVEAEGESASASREESARAGNGQAAAQSGSSQLPPARGTAATSTPAAAAAPPAGNGFARAAGDGGTAPPVAPPRRGERLSPAVRRLAAEYAIELARIEGSGRDGRITRRDVMRYLENLPAGTARAGQPEAAAAERARRQDGEARGLEASAERRVVPFTRVRKLTAEHMVRSKATSPHVLQAVEVDFANVDTVRKTVREAWRGRHGYSLTYLPFIAAAVCEALAEFPRLNASVDGESLILHESVHLAIAVDLGQEGLVAPVIHSADRMSVAELAQAIHEIAGRARQSRLKPDDLAGGTYTLSNSGTFGTLITAPIINQPQVAILSTDGVRKKPVVIEHPEGDSIAIRPVGVLAQSFDHRAVDGAYSAAFLDRVRKILERGRWTVEI